MGLNLLTSGEHRNPLFLSSLTHYDTGICCSADEITDAVDRDHAHHDQLLAGEDRRVFRGTAALSRRSRRLGNGVAEALARSIRDSARISAKAPRSP